MTTTRKPAAAANRTPVRQTPPVQSAPMVTMTRETFDAIVQGAAQAARVALAAHNAAVAAIPAAPAPVPLHTLTPEQFSAHAKATFAPTFAGPAVSDWAGQMWRARSAELAVGQ